MDDGPPPGAVRTTDIVSAEDLAELEVLVYRLSESWPQRPTPPVPH